MPPYPVCKILFSILGGTTAGFDRLGQTWSQPVVADIKVDGVVTPVLIFAGGYDPRYEGCYTDTACSTGGEPLGNSLNVITDLTQYLQNTCVSTQAYFANIELNQ